MTRTLLFACALLCAAPLSAQTCNFGSIARSTPPGTFIDNRDGTVTDSRFGLMWKRCSEGQTWSGRTCTGAASPRDWKDAMEHAEGASYAGYDDWRLPNLKELASIVEDACEDPAIDSGVFPITPSSEFWSASPTDYSYTAWTVDFEDGGDDRNFWRSSEHFIPVFRLVRNVAPVALNDTGIDWGGDYPDGNNVTCTSNSTIAAAQDCDQGRDATEYDYSDGHAGFIFTALDTTGQPMIPASGPTPHACVHDHVTSLTWEVKTGDGGPRDKDWTYTWFNTDPATNGGEPGAPSGTSNCFDSARCDTEKYVADVNAAGLCGFDDWRLPSKEELRSIVDYSRAWDAPNIDQTYFPNTPSGGGSFWTASPDAGSSYNAWIVGFGYGSSDQGSREYNDSRVRLVRGDQALSSARRTVQTMYVAYYGRPGDPGGLGYWSERLLTEGGDMSAIIDAFGTSDEYTSRYGGMTYEELVNNLYYQMFGRYAEPAGLAFYVDRLSSGMTSLAQIALQIADGAQNQDQSTLVNRVRVAEYFVRLVWVEDLSYGSDEIDQLVTILAGVDWSDDSVTAAMSEIDALFL